MFKERPPTPTQMPQTVEKPETKAKTEPNIEGLRNRLREAFGNIKNKGWIQFEESKDPTNRHEENYRLMVFYVPEGEIETYENLVDSFGFKKDDEYEDPEKMPDPYKYTRFTYPKYSFVGVKKPDEGFMIFRVGFEV